MWTSSITAYFHYLGFMLAFAALTVELFNLKSEMTLNDAKRVVFADAVYGMAAIIILITGVLRVLYFGKGTDYYLSNPFFYAKIGVFILVSLLSLYPTFTFIFWFKDLRIGQTPSLELTKVNLISGLIKGELLCFTILPLLAAVMARTNGIYV
jgi:putative membrane protein